MTKKGKNKKYHDHKDVYSESKSYTDETGKLWETYQEYKKYVISVNRKNKLYRDKLDNDFSNF